MDRGMFHRIVVRTRQQNLISIRSNTRCASDSIRRRFTHGVGRRCGSDVAPRGSPTRHQEFSEGKVTSPTLAPFKLVDLAPKSQIPRLVPYADPNDRPDEDIIKASVRVWSLDTIVVWEPVWVPPTQH